MSAVMMGYAVVIHSLGVEETRVYFSTSDEATAHAWARFAEMKLRSLSGDIEVVGPDGRVLMMGF